MKEFGRTGIRLALTSVLALAAAGAGAQTVTDIAPDTQPGFDTGTIVTTSGTQTRITGGEAAGGNLFHSFAQFDLGAGDTATWVRGAADAATILNIVNRVRSVDPSHIDGTLSVADMPNASFWFINPAGVIFGDGAAVDVPGAAYFSTAQELRLADGARFSTVTPDGSTFSSAAPQAFGFLGAQGSIGISGEFATDTASSVAFVARDVVVDGAIWGETTRFDFIAVGDTAQSMPLAALAQPRGEGVVRFDPGAQVVAGSARLIGGEVLLSDAAIFTNGLGDLVVRGDRVSLSDDALLQSETSAGAAGDIAIDAGLIEIAQGSSIVTLAGGDTGFAGGGIALRAGELVMEDAFITADTSASGAAGDVLIDVAGEIAMSGESLIASNSFGPGDAGDVTVLADSFTMTGFSILSAASLGEFAVAPGTVTVIVTDTLSLDQDAAITSESGAVGDAGAVFIGAGTLDLAGRARIAASTGGSGAGGNIGIEVDGTLALAGAAAITAEAAGEGDAGDVEIAARTVRLSGEALINSAALEGSGGEAGMVLIFADSLLEVSQDARISASTRGPGDAGQVLMDTGRLVMDGGEITSFTGGSGDAGIVLIRAGEAILTNGASINSLTEEGSSGNAGGVGIEVDGLLSLTDNDGDFADGLGVVSEISASTFGSGDAGTVIVQAGEILLRGGNITSATSGPGFAGDVTVSATDIALLFNSSIDSQAEFGSSGGAGDVFVAATGTLRIEPEGSISASSQGSGDAGIVEVRASVLDMAGGAINSFTGDTGDAGLVGVFVGELLMSGGRIDSASDSAGPDAGRAGSVFITANNAYLSGAAGIDSTGATGDAGDVTVAVEGRLEISDFASISAATVGSGNAGSVEVSADVLAIAGGQINSVTTGSGDAGAVSVLARELFMDDGRITSASESAFPGEFDTPGDGPQSADFVPGDAGDVLVRAGNATLVSGSSIDSTSEGSTAGTVTVLVEDRLSLSGFSEISTAARGGGDAGGILIEATSLLLDDFSEVSSTADGAFAAGLIAIFAEQIRIANGSAITTNSENGPAGDIGLFLPQDGFLGLSGVDPGVITTSSGANSGGRITIADPFLILSEGGSILALGEQGGANVEISSAFFIRSSDTVNRVSVDGSLLIESNVGEQITGTEVPTVDFLDASGILSGVCADARELGEVSAFSSRITGPYALPADPSGEEKAEAGTATDSVAEPIARSAAQPMATCL